MKRTRSKLSLPILALLASSACDAGTPPSTTGPGPSAPTPEASATAPQPSASAERPVADPPKTEPVKPGGPAQPAVDASNAFGLALFQELGAKAGNLAFSPASISLALAMTYAGAKGETGEQMKKALRFPEAAPELHGGWASVLHRWQNAKDLDIAVANRLYGDQSYTFERHFLGLTKASYGAPLLPVDFAGAPDAQRKLINDWVADTTHKRIEDLIPPPGIDEDTRLVLVNAMYFKAQWQSTFDKERTADAAFAAPGGSVTVPMMHQTEHMKYGEADGAKLCELSYQNEEFATLFVLPTEPNGLAALEKKLDAKVLSTWTSALSSERVDLKLPRFKLEPKGSVELKAPLQKLGMLTAFERETADFSGIANPKNPADRLFVGQVFHKAFVAMDESGTEAAAATAVVMPRAGGMPPEPKLFHADRPFLFFVRDVKTGLVMFAGRVADPSS